MDIGSNYLCSELQAALLDAQLANAPDIQARRRAVWDQYDAELTEWCAAHGIQRLAMLRRRRTAAPLRPADAVSRGADALIDYLRSHGILAVFHYIPLHLSPMGVRFGGAAGDCPVAEDISDRIVRLPFYADLSDDDQTSVIETVKSFVHAAV